MGYSTVFEMDVPLQVSCHCHMNWNKKKQLQCIAHGFLLHFLMHVDVLRLHRKFELIPTKIF